MKVQSLLLDHFRNYQHLEVNFHPHLNVIRGDNAQGKTNLLEAIACLSTTASHRTRSHQELIQMGEQYAFLRGHIVSHHRERTLELSLHRGGRRQMKANGVKQNTVSQWAGLLHTVLFCPEDLSLLRDGAAARRRFLDSCISQLRPRYAAALSEYRKLHAHKLRILRDGEPSPDLLDVFSQRMAQCGAILIHYRAHFVRRLCQTAPAIHANCSGGREQLGLCYQTVSTVTEPEAPPNILLEQLTAHQRSHRQAELATRSCLSGPHKDDLEVLVDGRPARTFASQGQTRTAALALKLAARDIFFQQTGEWPVLLLDDVLSELDGRRREFVLSRITDGQVFITCCEEELDGSRQGQSFHIHQGHLI